MKDLIQYKTFAFEVKDTDEAANEGRFEGYASTFGNVDLGLDKMIKGAFKKTIKESKGIIPILADHNPSEQIGWNEKAMEDDMGLLVSGAVDLNVQKGKEKFSLAKKAMKLGAKMGLSIGYMTIKGEPDTENPRIRLLKEVKLFEYSFVTFPMNVEAMVTQAKSLGGIDKANFFIQQLLKQGISLEDLKQALLIEPPKNSQLNDPEVIQSIDAIIKTLKS